MTPTTETPTTTTPTPSVPPMSAGARADFDAEVRKLKATSTSGPMDRAFAGIGVGTVLVGLVTCLIAYAQATGFDDVRDQLESLILACFGVALVVFGSAVYLRNSATRFMRFWLLRLVYEQRDRDATHDVDAAEPPRR